MTLHIRKFRSPLEHTWEEVDNDTDNVRPHGEIGAQLVVVFISACGSTPPSLKD